MKILMPMAQLALNYGGAEQQALRLAGALITRGHSVEILTSRPDGTPAYAEVRGVPVRRFFSFANRRYVWRLGYYTYGGRLLAELLRRRGRHDIVHVHQAFHPAWAAVMARKLGGAPTLVKVATAGPFGDLHQMRTGQVPLVGSARMLETILATADRMVAISSAVADELLAAGVPESRIARIPNGVDVPPELSPAVRREARASLGIPSSASVAVYVGRSERQKGGDVLLRSWGRVRQRRPDALLYILGEGFREDASLAALANAGGVVLTGRVADVPRFLKAADLFVLPSRGEGLSNAILEAMAYGLASLVSDLPANHDLIEEGKTGFLCPVGDEERLANGIVEAFSRPEMLRALGRAAREKVVAAFSVEEVARRYEALYEGLLRDRQARR